MSLHPDADEMIVSIVFVGGIFHGDIGPGVFLINDTTISLVPFWSQSCFES
jgi:hypothetical protein